MMHKLTFSYPWKDSEDLWDQNLDKGNIPEWQGLHTKLVLPWGHVLIRRNSYQAEFQCGWCFRMKGTHPRDCSAQRTRWHPPSIEPWSQRRCTQKCLELEANPPLFRLAGHIRLFLSFNFIYYQMSGARRCLAGAYEILSSIWNSDIRPPSFLKIIFQPQWVSHHRTSPGSKSTNPHDKMIWT